MSSNYHQQQREVYEETRKMEEAAGNKNAKITADKAVAAWQASRPLYESIEVRESSDRAEIRDHRFGGTVEVYRPRREMKWELGEEPTSLIQPGSLNGSSWSAGSYSRNSVELTQTEALHRLRMMQIAVHLLNTYNEVVLEWKPLPNALAEYEELTRFKANRLHHDAEEAAEIRKKKEEREAKKKSR